MSLASGTFITCINVLHFDALFYMSFIAIDCILMIKCNAVGALFRNFGICSSQLSLFKLHDGGMLLVGGCPSMAGACTMR